MLTLLISNNDTFAVISCIVSFSAIILYKKSIRCRMLSVFT